MLFAPVTRSFNMEHLRSYKDENSILSIPALYVFCNHGEFTEKSPSVLYQAFPSSAQLLLVQMQHSLTLETAASFN